MVGDYPIVSGVSGEEAYAGLVFAGGGDPVTRAAPFAFGNSICTYLIILMNGIIAQHRSCEVGGEVRRLNT